MLKKACRKSGCSNISSDTYCAEHQPTKERRPINNDYIYNSHAWTRLASNNKIKYPMCLYCNEVEAHVTDHYVEINDGGAVHNEDNLVSACHLCHNIKTANVRRARRENALLPYYVNNAPTELSKAYVYEWIKRNNLL